MGATYTICYCIGPYRQCKRRSLTRNDFFDHDHWDEIKDNVLQYLDEEVCVPGADMKQANEKNLLELLEEYVSLIAKMRRIEVANVDKVQPLFDRMHEVNSKILQFSVDLCNQDFPYQVVESSPSFEKIEFPDPFSETAKFLSLAALRAANELKESRAGVEKVYLYHHRAIFYDIVQEMTRLALEASVVMSEKFLAESHAHRRLLEERWQRDEIVESPSQEVQAL